MKKYVLITGGAGFIGFHLATRFASQGERVLIYDNLSRKGVKKNLSGLISRYPDLITSEISDILDKKSLEKAINHASKIYHFAAQVGSHRCISDPMLDFEINLRGTLNILEIMRKSHTKAPLIFTSPYPLPNEPYGCSKSAADQYVLNYSKNFGLQSAVLRVGTTYGPQQQGHDKFEWITYFINKILSHEPLILEWDGHEVRDALSIDDLVDALILTANQMSQLSGQDFLIGGGKNSSISPLALLELLKDLHGSEPMITHRQDQCFHQKFYFPDYSKFTSITGWYPKIILKRGITDLYYWMRDMHHSQCTNLEKTSRS